MNIFNLLSLFGGLAMFLYGMRMMSDGMKESSSGTLKIVLEKVTNNIFKAFLLGVGVTALIQSSTATIVITSGLVGAGLLTLRQSLGIVIGANVGTTVTGQIIRLLDLDSTSVGWLQVFKPSTLAPVALIVGIVLLMAPTVRNSRRVGNIAIGFGILFSGLLNMTAAVDVLAETGIFENLFSRLGSNPFLGYLTGAGVAFVLQSSSATIGILQAFSSSGALTFNAIYAVIVGIYLGDCVTTAIVCSIGAKPEARRVGVVNILFNLSETVLVLAAVNLARQLGLLDSIWNSVVTPGSIANTNTVFNLGCAILLFPLLPVYERLSRKIVRGKPESENKYKEKFDALNPVFFNTPALALRSCYNLLLTMFSVSRENIRTALGLLSRYDEGQWKALQEAEDDVDLMADRLDSYLVPLSAYLSADLHISILSQYHNLVNEFEHLSDFAVNIAETARSMSEKQVSFSETAMRDLSVLDGLIFESLDHCEQAFKTRNLDEALHIEPLAQVMSELVYNVKENHLARLRSGECGVDAGTSYMNILGDLERISGVCSNIGLSVVARVTPELTQEPHVYLASLRAGQSEAFNAEYRALCKEYLDRLRNAVPAPAGEPKESEK